jgi:septum formation protein
VADALAEAKARKVAGRRPEALVVGCDQVLELEGAVLGKPGSPEEALAQIGRLAGRAHRLHSAAVAYAAGAPAWRQVESATLTMRRPSEDWLAGYVARNWEAIRGSVGGYVIEGEGVRLMASVRGDGFAIRGMPLVPLLNWLLLRGEIEG